MRKKLEPCPFCGNEEIMLWPMGEWKSPVCTMCGATISENFSTGKSTKLQIKAWNRRVSHIVMGQ